MADAEHSSAEFSSRGARILLVDDTELSRDLVGAMLTRAGYLVDAVADGESAWELTWSKSYDLVLMDLEMPGLSGFEAAARIRAREGVMSGVPIAALSATVQPQAEQLSLWSGIDEYITKPIQAGPLVARVEALLAKRPAGGADDWKPVWRLHAFDDWTCDLDQQEATECLEELDGLLAEAAAAIHVNATDGELFYRLVDTLESLAGRYGFDEIAGVCTCYAAPRTAHGRSRDPNLLGAIGRARYAIGVYMRDHAPPPPQGRWARTFTTVQALFGRQAA